MSKIHESGRLSAFFQWLKHIRSAGKRPSRTPTETQTVLLFHSASRFHWLLSTSLGFFFPARADPNPQNQRTGDESFAGSVVCSNVEFSGVQMLQWCQQTFYHLLRKSEWFGRLTAIHCPANWVECCRLSWTSASSCMNGVFDFCCTRAVSSRIHMNCLCVPFQPSCTNRKHKFAHTFRT